MKTSTLLICLFSLMAGPVSAQTACQDTDCIGVYFDDHATITLGSFVSTIPFNAYVVATNISSDGLSGFEFTFEFAGNEVLVMDTAFAGTNSGQPPEYIVGMSAPLPFSPAVVLMDFTLYPADADQIDFFLSPVAAPTMDGLCSYLDGDDTPVGLTPHNGDWEQPTATVSCGCYYSTSEESWGGVKTMFR